MFRYGVPRVNKADPGTQSLDLAGHTLTITNYPLALGSDEFYLNQQVGTAADGIFDSSSPAANYAIGVARVASLPTARLTLYGDANLDRAVDFNDLVLLAQNYNTASNGLWSRADFTRDGVTDFNDLVKLAQNYNAAFPSEPIPDASAEFTQDLAAAFATVPEPATAGALVACGLMGATLRRRRRART
jgi:hypothetical protein